MVNEPTQETLNSYDFNGWTSIQDNNWIGVNTSSPVADTNKLIISANDVSKGVALFVPTIAGKKYTVSYDLDLVNSSGINTKAINAGTLLYRSQKLYQEDKASLLQPRVL